MAEENSITSDSNTEILKSIPSQAIRENLVATAVHFLNNPRVNKSPLIHKTAFLQKKGLTESEINVALARASIGSENVSEQTSLVPSNGSILAPLPVVPHSIWYHIHRVGSSFIIIGIALYGAHQIYKLYVEPWLYGKSADKNRITLMEQQLIEMNRTLSELRRTVSELQEVLSSQKEQVNRMYENEVNYYPTPLVLNDLKAEVGSIKSLLLNRHQFPSAPKVSPSIPIWQMSSKENDKIVEENSESKTDKIPNGDINTKLSTNDENENLSSVNNQSSSPIIDVISLKTEDSETHSIELDISGTNTDISENQNGIDFVTASGKDKSDQIV